MFDDRVAAAVNAGDMTQNEEDPPPMPVLSNQGLFTIDMTWSNIEFTREKEIYIQNVYLYTYKCNLEKAIIKDLDIAIPKSLVTDLQYESGSFTKTSLIELLAHLDTAFRQVLPKDIATVMETFRQPFVAAIPSGSAFSTSRTNISSAVVPSTSRLGAFKFGGAPAAAAVEEPVLQEKLFDPLTDVFITTLRIGPCALMIHHGIDKIDNVEDFSKNVVAKFFGFLPGDLAFWTLSAAGTQVAGSVLLAVGVLARPVALSMCATMFTAVVFHLLNTGPEGFPLTVVPQHSYNYELAAMYVDVLAYFSVAGAGAYSVDEIVFGGELNLYGNVLNKVFGGKGDKEDAVTDTYVENEKEFKAPWSK